MTSSSTNSEEPEEPNHKEVPQVLIEQLERQQALLQSLLGQISTMISAADERELLDVVCTQLLASGLFIGAWIGHMVSPNASRFEVLAAGSNGQDILDALTDEQRLLFCDYLARAQFQNQVLIEASDHSSLTEPWRSFVPNGAKTSIFFIPIFRNELPWAVLVVVHLHYHALDKLVADTLLRLSELIDTALGQLDLRKRLSEEHERTAYLAYHDALTSLANRRYLDEELPKAIARAERNEQSLAIVMLDLDDFKPINDQYGHAVGDELLVTLAARLKKILRSSDLAVRQGGDEFILLVEGITSKDDLTHSLERIRKSLEKPYELPEGKARIQVSMGVTVYPEDNATPDQLIRHADAALYASKDQKHRREHPWQFWHELNHADPETRIEAFKRIAPYGPEAAALLGTVRAEVRRLTGAFVDRFYRELVNADPDSAKIIGWLSPEEYEHLRTRQTKHLEFLLSPDLTEEEHLARARSVGMIHAFIGVSGSSLVRAITIYMHQFDDASLRSLFAHKQFNSLKTIITARLSTELCEELEAEVEVGQRYQSVLRDIDVLGRSRVSWPDFNDQLLKILCGLPAIRAAWIGAPDETGRFVINFVHLARDIENLWEEHPDDATLPSMISEMTNEQGSTALAFRTAQIQRNNNFTTRPDRQKWQALAQRTGIRSSVSIPLMDAQRRPIAVLTLCGGYPGMFEALHRASFSHHLGFIVSHTWQRLNQYPNANILIQEITLWRQALYGQGVRFVYQPIVDLKTGELIKVEALARLDLPDGRTIMPGQFIPQLNEDQIIHLFRKGLDIGLAQLRLWQRCKKLSSIGLSLNLPLEALQDEGCADWVFDALKRYGVPAERLWLEVLENTDTNARGQILEHMNKLIAQGVHLAMDDLGSGYSSLLRLNKLPFDTVKIDQALILSAYAAPPRVIRLISALIRMTHALDSSVIVEGLEHPDLIETAHILGAEMGQGYGLSYPLAPEQLEDWIASHKPSKPVDYPKTPMGAIAWYVQYTDCLSHADAPRDLTNPADCPVHHFIEEYGLIDSEIDHAHLELHATQRKNEEQYLKRLNRFQSLLAELVFEPPPKIDTGPCQSNASDK